MDFFEVVYKRRSVRRYKPEPVPLKDIKKMVEIASLAPSAHNLKPWRFVIVYNREKIKEVVDAVHKGMDAVISSKNVPDDLKEKYERLRYYFTFYIDAPVVIVVCGERMVIPSKEAVRLAFPEKAAASPTNSIEQSVSAAIQNLILAATALGYGSCWATGPLVAHEKIKEILNIPENWDIYAIVPVGRPEKEPTPKNPQEFEDIAIVIE